MGSFEPTLRPVRTLDGSWSLECSDGLIPNEMMHSQKGALSESKYVYGEAFERTLEYGLPLNFSIVGLGLGTIELTLISMWARQPSEQLKLRSFESNPLLSHGFAEWIQDKPHRDSDQGLRKSLDDNLNLLSKHSSVPASYLKKIARSFIEDGHWVIRPELSASTLSVETPVSAVMYDAYSRRTQPHLWTETWLSQVLQTWLPIQGVFATYASCTSLRRTLQGCGFEIADRPGFGGKREMTIATKRPHLSTDHPRDS